MNELTTMMIPGHLFGGGYTHTGKFDLDIGQRVSRNNNNARKTIHTGKVKMRRNGKKQIAEELE